MIQLETEYDIYTIHTGFAGTEMEVLH